MTDEKLRALVEKERSARGLSVRAAAKISGISNTAWSDFENGVRHLTPAVQHAVATAFDWPITWPTDKKSGSNNRAPAASADHTHTDLEELKEQVARLEVALEALAIRTVKTAARTRKPRRPRPTDPVD